MFSYLYTMSSGMEGPAATRSWPSGLSVKQVWRGLREGTTGDVKLRTSVNLCLCRFHMWKLPS